MLSEKLTSQLLSIPEFFSLGWSVFKNNLLTILYLVLSIQVPLQILYYYVENSYLTIITSSSISILLPMGIAYIVERQLNNETISIKNVYAKLFSVWIAGILANFLSMLIIAGMTLLLIIPGMVWFIYYIFVLYVVVLKGKKWKGALDYSKSLVVGKWWLVLGYSIVFGLISFPFFITYVLTRHSLAIAVTSLAIAEVVGAYATVLSVLLFLNLDGIKTAKEAMQEETVIDAIPQFIRPEILSK